MLHYIHKPLIVISSIFSLGSFASEIEFRADYYQRDLQANIVRAKGHAWVKKGHKEIWADELEIDFMTNRAIANGSVHILDGETEIWCQHGNYNLSGEDAILEDATLTLGQMVLSGKLLRKLNPKVFEIEEGTYTNCNVELNRTKEIAQCPYDWKIYGRAISATLEQYAHIYDGIFYAKQLPLFYTPYAIIPIKTQRQSGFLLPTLGYWAALGNSITLPYFLVLGPWHDLTLTPIYYSKVGYHIGLNYRYIYSPDRFGIFDLFILQERFKSDRDKPFPVSSEERQTLPHTLGFVGEWAIHFRNSYAFGNRIQSRQALRLVSDPFYLRHFGGSLENLGDFGFLRSHVSLTIPGDNLLFTSEVQYLQPLIVSTDTGVDQGSVSQLPTIGLSYKTSPIIAHLSYEIDSRITNFYRAPKGFDPLPLKTANQLKEEKIHSDPDPNFHPGDYIREGQRLQIEPRLIFNVPLPSGFQLQPILRAGTLLYHFDVPQSQLQHREYSETDVPFSMYLSKTFNTNYKGYEKVKHIFQPRFIYASSLYQSKTPDHPFFFVDKQRGLSNPRYDILDQLTPFEYMRFELINRFLRLVDSHSERFFLFQIAEEYNLKPSQEDPRYSHSVGPIEALSELRLGTISAQLQANYQLERTPKDSPEGIHEYDWSGSVEYSEIEGDRFRLNQRFSIRSDDNLTDKTLDLYAYKRLPAFFDLDGTARYSMKKGRLLGYRLGFIFFTKPRSCWAVSLNLGRDDLDVAFVNLNFRFSFGNPVGGTPVL